MPIIGGLHHGIFFLAIILTTVCVAGSAAAYGTESPVSAAVVHGQSPDWILDGVPDLVQHAPYTCGATAVQSVLSYWGTVMPQETLVALLNTTRQDGTPPENIINGSRALGYFCEIRTDLTPADLETIVRAGIPVIVGVGETMATSSTPFNDVGRNYGHYMVVIGFDRSNVWLEDPAFLGNRTVIPRRDFLTQWRIVGKDIRRPDALAISRMAVILRGSCTSAAPCSGKIHENPASIGEKG